MRTLKLKIIFILILTFSFGWIFAQDQIALEGKIMDDKSQQPVSFATVSLYNKLDSSLVKGTLTDEKGQFTLSLVKNGDYYLTISNVGYQNKTFDKIEFNQGNKKLDLGNIAISTQETELKEVVIVQNKMKGQEKVDRTVYNITDKIKEISTSGLDVLKQIPAVNVDFQNNVTLEGRSDILFYVNDIQRDKNFVAQINPASIERVEVMTNPSTKYDADVSGIIHFYLKKERAYGMNGSVALDIPSPPTYIMDPMANLEYGNDNVRFYVSDNLHFEQFNGYQESNTIKYLPGSTEEQLKKGEGTLSWRSNSLNYGIDWFINEKNTINFYGDFNYFQSIFRDFNFDNRYYVNDVLTGRENILQNNNETGKTNYYSIYYKNKMNDKKELSMLIGYYNYSGENNNNYHHDVYDLASDEILNSYYREDNVSNHRNSAEYKVDYSQAFEKSNFEAGLKSYYQWIDNNQKYSSDAEPINFVYDEFRQAAYVNYSFKVKKVMVQTGLRTEYSNINIDNNEDNEYFCWLPQMSMKRDFEKNQSLKLGYRRRIYRPGIDELNPFEVWYDSLHFYHGNPELKPSYSNDMELVYSKNFNSSMISPKLYAKYVTDDFQNVTFINDENITETYTDNIGKVWEYGLGFSYAIQLTKWWNINGYLSVYDKIIDSQPSQGSSNSEPQEKVSYQINTNSVMTFFKTWNYFMMVNYNSPTISYQRTSSRDLLWIIGFEKELFKNGKLQAIYFPPYTNRFMFHQNETETAELYDMWKGEVLVDYLFSIKFTYNFSSGKKTKKLERNVEYDSDGNKSLF
ncbi:MAG: outer membrane beta-barrel family protein [Bacteroidales bacterium]